MPAVSPELQLEVQDFLFREATMLEENQLEEWLALFTDDARYTMPVRRNAQPVKKAGKTVPDDVETFALFDDDKGSLELRVRRIGSDLAHAETPVSVTQRFISNVRVERADDGTLEVYSSFIVYQERRGRHSAMFLGSRHDRLRRDGASLKIAERHIKLAQAVLPTTISIFL